MSDKKDTKKPVTSGRCYETHPPMALPGVDTVIYGGSCSYPVVTDADIYIGFDRSMKVTQRAWPWKKGTEFLFTIMDMNAPGDPVEFGKLIVWTRKHLDAGAKIHAGCLGGHGRTGTFLAALVAHYGEKNAIQYVREHYCKKVVESQSQVDFLVKNYGVAPAEPAKTYTKAPSGGSGGSGSTHISSMFSGIAGLGDKNHVYSPVKHPRIFC